jgi:hypothetical protein
MTIWILSRITGYSIETLPLPKSLKQGQTGLRRDFSIIARGITPEALTVPLFSIRGEGTLKNDKDKLAMNRFPRHLPPITSCCITNATAKNSSSWTLYLKTTSVNGWNFDYIYK